MRRFRSSRSWAPPAWGYSCARTPSSLPSLCPSFLSPPLGSVPLQASTFPVFAPSSWFGPARMLSTSTEQEEPVKIERRTLKNGSYATVITLSRPEKLNALDLNMFHAIAKAAEDVARDRDTRVVVLRGAGRAFCSGLDVKSILSNPLKVSYLTTPSTILMVSALPYTHECSNFVMIEKQGRWVSMETSSSPCDCGHPWSLLRRRFSDCTWSRFQHHGGKVGPGAGHVSNHYFERTGRRYQVPIDVAKELTMTARIFNADEAKALRIESELQNVLLKGWNVVSSVAKVDDH
eukprot:754582-Hanusia_phi.AAC.13